MATIIGTGLASYLHRQARKAALNRIEEAREQAAALRAEAEARAAALRAEIAAQAAAESDERTRRVLAQARLAARQLMAKRREEVLARMWAELGERLRLLEQAPPGERLRLLEQAPPGERLALLERLTADAAAQLGGGELLLQVAERDRPLLTEDVLAAWSERLATRCGVTSLRPAPDPLPAGTGVILYRPETQALVDNTIEARLALVQRERRDEIGWLLSEGEAG